ncbi:hypothetical protein [Candidatus Nitrosotenuis uzonensis]|uniref:Uncharacterized protein n=1 Tax=Candidatus Nitrosotenuis uzonensis TaxID=1407055 RepID=A0A812EV67_9ARCH|nr:hypothetical protein [Candidatus Nitrosotenuis uzonensis]CAE6492486.1 conserved hypothetical protein [Candidatus Nitrosotenuis uzonensis]
MEPALMFAAAAMVVIGLVGQGFEMRKIRKSITTDEQLSSKNVFVDRRNLKWYAIIGAGLILYYFGGGSRV